MPDSVLFADGDLRTYSNGAIAGNGALSVVVIAKPTVTLDAYRWLVNWNAAGAQLFGVQFGAAIAAFNGSEVTGATVPATNEWYLFGYTKASGTATPRYHLYRYSNTTWDQGNFGGTLANWAACTSVQFAVSGSENWIGNILIAGVWDSALSDGAVQGLISSKGAWTTAAPDEAWRFDTAGTITPFVGTSTQTASTGGTLDTGDAPAGWSDGSAVQSLNPSADSVDGTWTDNTGGTALAAAIDEDTASDTDFIRSVLSPSTSGCRVKLETGSDPASSTGHIIRWRGAKDATGGQAIGLTVKLYQGGGNVQGAGTLIASFTRSNVSNTFTDFAETLSGGEADSITNYGDLYLEFFANAT